MSTPRDPFGPPDDQPSQGQPGQAPAGQQPGQQPSGQQPPRPPARETFMVPAGQQPGGAPYGGQPWGSGAPAGPARNGLGVAALVLGILAVVTSFTVVGGVLLGLAAIVLGALGRGRVKRGEADNGGSAIAGIVLGLLGLLISAAIVAFGVAFFSSDTGRSLVDCLEQAGNDPAAQQACQRDAEDSLVQ